ncbi:hypothetical protein AMTRI_Chr10g5260 [Amborella trichopoda]|uniref:Cytochrome b561 and DOMON domain-containing protein n=1 Tax=Amborella trichopoda TaxID=13333 RepID=U5D7R2_AMBTC|nr:cytochrome b561 and DOMON domain-containing protein At5g47530 [Amborella trichopoda]ERN18280.1 hypothetical protein AMTR_s00055p00154770 [Amborella trichopoda]|eukprot:XP_006856813.1 cytochrome b561 and DOMON domain-containing protein At5g47530 [Amborella trichopoda]
MAKPIFVSLLFLSLACSILTPTSAQTCRSQTFTNNRVYQSCNDLSPLSSYLHWNYHSANNSVDIAYKAPPAGSNGWVAWALNPLGSGMLGAQTLFGVMQQDGTAVAYTCPIGRNNYNPTIENQTLSFDVSNLSAEASNGEITIFASIALPSSGSINHVWQAGSSVSGIIAQSHSTTSTANRNSKGSINFATGAGTATSGDSRIKRRNTHGVLNAISWGILMPMGAIIARYMRVFKSADPIWFYLHVACQTSAYIVGVAGWGTGLKLGSESVGIVQNPHRNIGIALFCLGTLQVFALLLRPQKDHKYRFYWNVYHHSVGYTVIILSIINIFQGFDILQPKKTWKNAYIGVIIALGAVAVLLEVITWIVVLKRKPRTSSEKFQHGSHTVNGQGSQHQVV